MLAAAYVTVGGEVRQSVSTTLYTAICYSTAAAGLGLLCAGGGQALVGFDGRTWLCLLALTAGPQFLGHSVVNRVLRTTSATVVSVAKPSPDRHWLVAATHDTLLVYRNRGSGTLEDFLGREPFHAAEFAPGDNVESGEFDPAFGDCTMVLASEDRNSYRVTSG